MKKNIAKIIYWTMSIIGKLFVFLMCAAYLAALVCGGLYGAIYDAKHFWPAIGIIVGIVILIILIGCIYFWAVENKDKP